VQGARWMRSCHMSIGPSAQMTKNNTSFNIVNIVVVTKDVMKFFQKHCYG